MPAKANFTSRTIAHINIAGQNIKAQRVLVRRMQTRVFARLIKNNFESGPRVVDIEALAKQIIATNIYQKSKDPESSTGNLYDSFKVEADKSEGEGAALSLYSDPDIATAWGNPAWSYAAFFEEPEAFKTFIPPKAKKKAPENYRPFFAALVKMMQMRIPRHAIMAVFDAIVAACPPGLEIKIR